VILRLRAYRQNLLQIVEVRLLRYMYEYVLVRALSCKIVYGDSTESDHLDLCFIDSSIGSRSCMVRGPKKCILHMSVQLYFSETVEIFCN
jgi:hypothetical protein